MVYDSNNVYVDAEQSQINLKWENKSENKGKERSPEYNILVYCDVLVVMY